MIEKDFGSTLEMVKRALESKELNKTILLAILKPLSEAGLLEDSEGKLALSESQAMHPFVYHFNRVT
jgi:hypothetical protein